MATTTEAIRVEDIGRLELIDIDPYRRDTGTPASIQLWLDPEARRCLLETYSPGQGVPVAEWHGRQITIPVDNYDGQPNGPAIVQWLRSEAGQALLGRLCAGHSEEWDGNNYVGRLDADAQAAREAIERYLSASPTLPDGAGLWDAGDWLSGCAADLGITAETTDEEITALADRLEAEAAAECVVLDGAEEWLTARRAALAKANGQE
ncbi:MAG: hypothetical protein WC789_09390 [Lentisphaeria bacterium]